jgi:hypothetical protein
MSCCGQHRDQIRTQTSAALAATEPRSSIPSATLLSLGKGAVALRYREHARLQVRGPITGRTYDFASAQAAVMVDLQDADALLRTRLFTRAVDARS